MYKIIDKKSRYNTIEEEMIYVSFKAAGIKDQSHPERFIALLDTCESITTELTFEKCRVFLDWTSSLNSDQKNQILKWLCVTDDFIRS